MLLAREFGWNIEDIKQLRPSELEAIIKELQKQKEIQEYVEFKGKWAFLASVITNGFAAIANMFSKRRLKEVKPDDFIDKKYAAKIERYFKEAQDEDKWASYIAEAKAKGLKGPW
ncbi:hypothetical protein ABG79_02189 [Caloramator mitchellensis]|uniref:Uncharacterized protein n=1 Tax=Caloramator mitchellensis TaxID=908809 RepID=A0A0R3JRI8_CALMK|nr:hypothetical protein [Caloramator mitchellensis]KRQ86057.1 hypothetical protein ABG79_02189 [Caloramator mitchellensis]